MMKLLLHIKNSSDRFYYKILRCFLMLIFLILFMWLLYFYYFKHTLLDDFSRKLKMNLDTSIKTIDENMRIAQESSFNFFNNETVLSLLTPEHNMNIQQRASMFILCKNIGYVQNILTNIVSDIFVYNDNARVYTSRGMYYTYYFFERYYSFSDYNTDFWMDELVNTYYPVKFLAPTKTIITEENYTEELMPVIIQGVINGYKTNMVLCIPMSRIRSAIKSNSLFSKSDYAIVDSEGKIILPFESKSINDSFINSTNNSNEKSLLVNNTRYIVVSNKSNYFDWTYYSLTPMDEFVNYNLNIYIITAIVCLLLIVIGVTFSALNSHMLYRPVKKLLSMFQSNSDQPQYSNIKNEFVYIEDNIHDIIQYNNHLKDIMTFYFKNYLDYPIAQMLISGQNNLTDDYISKFNEEFSMKGDIYVCYNLFFNMNNGFLKGIDNEDYIVHLIKLRKAIASLANQYMPTYVLELKQGLFVCITNINTIDEKSKIYEVINKIVDYFKQDLSYCDEFRIYCGIGGICWNLHNIRYSYDEGMAALRKCDSKKSYDVVDFMYINDESKVSFSLEDERRIFWHLESKNIHSLMQIIDTIISKNNENNTDNESMNRLIKSILDTGIRFLHEKKLSLEKILEREHYNFLFATFDWMKNENDIRLEIKKFFEDIIYHIEDNDSNEITPIIYKIKEYVMKNYQEELCMEKIAEVMNVSAKYVSKIFKEKTAISLVDFINKIRVDKAKELLINTNMKVEDIAENVGIYNRVTFNRIFKKTEGITPTDYRRQYYAYNENQLNNIIK